MTGMCGDPLCPSCGTMQGTLQTGLRPEDFYLCQRALWWSSALRVESDPIAANALAVLGNELGRFWPVEEDRVMDACCLALHEWLQGGGPPSSAYARAWISHEARERHPADIARARQLPKLLRGGGA